LIRENHLPKRLLAPNKDGQEDFLRIFCYFMENAKQNQHKNQQIYGQHQQKMIKSEENPIPNPGSISKCNTLGFEASAL